MTCALCHRIVPDERISDPQVVQKHHPRPEERAESPTVVLYRPCHKQIHALFTNKELRESYDTIQALRNAERLAAYFEWTRGIEKLDIQTATRNHIQCHFHPRGNLLVSGFRTSVLSITFGNQTLAEES